jgi:hypothetical protein
MAGHEKFMTFDAFLLYPVNQVGLFKKPVEEDENCPIILHISSRA